jgi:uncharacterized protein YndB with AHSA1/START domain
MTATATTLIQDDELVIERVLDAPPELVFAVWTTPAHLMNWWGPRDFTTIAFEQDFRVGGAYRAGIRAPDGTEHWKSGIYQEIVPHQRIVMTFRWDDGAWDGLDNLVTVTFTPMASGRTLFRFHQGRFHDVAARDSHVAGWAGLIEKLTTSLETVQ